MKKKINIKSKNKNKNKNTINIEIDNSKKTVRKYTNKKKQENTVQPYIMPSISIQQQPNNSNNDYLLHQLLYKFMDDRDQKIQNQNYSLLPQQIYQPQYQTNQPYQQQQTNNLLIPSQESQSKNEIDKLFDEELFEKKTKTNTNSKTY